MNPVLPWHGVSLPIDPTHACPPPRLHRHSLFQETFFYTESTTVNPNSSTSRSTALSLVDRSLVHRPARLDTSNSPAPVIVTRTLSTSNVRNASSTIVQTTPTNTQLPSSTQMPHLHPRVANRNTASPSVGLATAYHPITTEL